MKNIIRIVILMYMRFPAELMREISSYLKAEIVLELASESSEYNNLMILDINKCIDAWNIKQTKFVEGNMLWFAYIKSGHLGTLKYLYKYRKALCGMWKKIYNTTSIIKFTEYIRPENIEDYIEVSTENATYYNQHAVADWLKTITI